MSSRRNKSQNSEKSQSNSEYFSASSRKSSKKNNNDSKKEDDSGTESNGNNWFFKNLFYIFEQKDQVENSDSLLPINDRKNRIKNESYHTIHTEVHKSISSKEKFKSSNREYPFREASLRKQKILKSLDGKLDNTNPIKFSSKQQSSHDKSDEEISTENQLSVQNKKTRNKLMKCSFQSNSKSDKSKMKKSKSYARKRKSLAEKSKKKNNKSNSKSFNRKRQTNLKPNKSNRKSSNNNRESSKKSNRQRKIEKFSKENQYKTHRENCFENRVEYSTLTDKSLSKKSNEKSYLSKSSQQKQSTDDRLIDNVKIGFIGAGKMTEAILKALLVFAKLDPKKIFISAKNSRNLERFKHRSIRTSSRSYDVFGAFDCDIVFLCVHGFVVRSCFKGGGTRPFAMTINYIPNQKHPLYVLSLIGGVSIDQIKQTLLDPENPEKYLLEMHRIMLNIGVAYGLGFAFIDAPIKSKQCSKIVRELLSSITDDIDYLPEKLIDAACTVGGNGLAFSYYFIAALADGGFKIGLNKHMSIRLACMTLQTAAQSIIESQIPLSELQDQAISQGGPTIHGIHYLNKKNNKTSIIEAIDVAYQRLKYMTEFELAY